MTDRMIISDSGWIVGTRQDVFVYSVGCMFAFCGLPKLSAQGIGSWLLENVL